MKNYSHILQAGSSFMAFTDNFHASLSFREIPVSGIICVLFQLKSRNILLKGYKFFSKS